MSVSFAPDSRRTARYRAARAISEIFAPVPLGAVVVTYFAWRFSSTTGAALRGAAIGVLLGLIVPFSYLLRQVRHGRVTDRHVGIRTQRPRILLAFIGAVTAALAILLALGAARELIALLGAGVVGAAVAFAITLRWKISIHTGVIAGVVTILILALGPWAFSLAPLVALVGWARVTVKDHTPAQVIAGAVIGASVSATAFVILARLLP